MEVSFVELYETRPKLEIQEVDVNFVDKIIENAEEYVFDLYSNQSSGGILLGTHSAMIRSLIESYARNEAIHLTGEYSTITNEAYEKAFQNVTKLITKNYDNINILYNQWFENIISYIYDIFRNSNKIFESYLIGYVCSLLYLDNKNAKIIIEELKNKKILSIDSKKYNVNLITLTQRDE